MRCFMAWYIPLLDICKCKHNPRMYREDIYKCKHNPRMYREDIYKCKHNPRMYREILSPRLYALTCIRFSLCFLFCLDFFVVEFDGI